VHLTLLFTDTTPTPHFLSISLHLLPGSCILLFCSLIPPQRPLSFPYRCAYDRESYSSVYWHQPNALFFFRILAPTPKIVHLILPSSVTNPAPYAMQEECARDKWKNTDGIGGFQFINWMCVQTRHHSCLNTHPLDKLENTSPTCLFHFSRACMHAVPASYWPFLSRALCWSVQVCYWPFLSRAFCWPEYSPT
jgi:hypothetical protein